MADDSILASLAAINDVETVVLSPSRDERRNSRETAPRRVPSVPARRHSISGATSTPQPAPSNYVDPSHLIPATARNFRSSRNTLFSDLVGSLSRKGSNSAKLNTDVPYQSVSTIRTAQQSESSLGMKRSGSGGDRLDPQAQAERLKSKDRVSSDSLKNNPPSIYGEEEEALEESNAGGKDAHQSDDCLQVEDVPPQSALRRRSTLPNAKSFEKLKKDTEALHDGGLVPSTARDLRPGRNSVLVKLRSPPQSQHGSLNFSTESPVMSPPVTSQTSVTYDEYREQLAQFNQVLQKLKLVDPNPPVAPQQGSSQSTLMLLGSSAGVLRHVEDAEAGEGDNPDDPKSPVSQPKPTNIKFSKPSSSPRKFSALPRIDSAGSAASSDLRKSLYDKAKGRPSLLGRGEVTNAKSTESIEFEKPSNFLEAEDFDSDLRKRNHTLVNRGEAPKEEEAKPASKGKTSLLNFFKGGKLKLFSKEKIERRTEA
ncbi:hypothetical protein HDU96_008708 [Phlyctochytrium bullatum]|nr:hypothetical protein HDU96_008708 [Phlyctochytrium bullatum]